MNEYTRLYLTRLGIMEKTAVGLASALMAPLSVAGSALGGVGRGAMAITGGNPWALGFLGLGGYQYGKDALTGPSPRDKEYIKAKFGLPSTYTPDTQLDSPSKGMMS